MGWGLRSSELLLTGQMQEKRKYVLLTELVQCKAGKEREDRLKIGSAHVYPFLYTALFPFGVALNIRIAPY